jgi:hypothetical protein
MEVAREEGNYGRSLEAALRACGKALTKESACSADTNKKLSYDQVRTKISQ